jgi:hypothetical protein
MAGVRVEGSRYVRATPAQLFAMVSRLETWPRWTSLWMRADVAARRQNQALVRLGGYVGGLPVESTVRSATKSPSRVEWRQAHGTLIGYAGVLEIAKEDDGARIRYETALDSGIPFLDDDAVRQILVQEVDRTLRRIKSSAEREIVAEEIRLMKSRPQSPPATTAPTPPAVAAPLAPDSSGSPESADTAVVAGSDAEPDEADDAQDGQDDSASAAETPGEAGATPARRKRRRRRRRSKGAPAPDAPPGPPRS